MLVLAKGSVRSCMCDGGVFRCFLWWSDVSLCARYSSLLEGSGFYLAFVVLVLLRVALVLVSGGTLGLVISVAVAGQILEPCLQIAHGVTLHR